MGRTCSTIVTTKIDTREVLVFDGLSATKEKEIRKSSRCRKIHIQFCR